MTDDALDLDRFLALPRLAGLHLSPDGTRLVVGVQTVAADGRSYTGAIWQIDPAGVRPARRLTRSATGETAVGFLGDGSLVFLSARPDPERSGGGDASPAAALHVLPASGGEARRLLEPSGGVVAAVTAARGRTVVAAVPHHPGVAGVEADAAREKERTEAGVSARLHERYPIRWWDHPLGPRSPHLLALDVDDSDDAPAWRDLTPEPPWEGWLEDASLALDDGGSALGVGARLRWGRDLPADLVGVDLGGGGLRLLSREDGDHENLAWSPDGRRCACSLTTWGTPDDPRRVHLLVVDGATGERSRVATEAGWTGVSGIAWAPDASALFVLADERGHVPVFRVDLPGGAVTRLTATGAYTDLCVSPDGATLYALRSHVDQPPVPVAIDATTPDQVGRRLPAPGAAPALRTTVREVQATSADGTPVHAWLVLPEGASARTPAPLAVFIHGGPLAAFAGWSWRWNAQLVAAHGYAVLTPNPRLSTGYGVAHIDSSWTEFADIPAADILAATDAAAALPEVDGTRMAAMGGSYGGYMANWLAGHTDRFRAIVSHAGLWALDQFRGTSDVGIVFDRHFGDPEERPDQWERQSPRRHIDAVRTPMLVIHGERDDRVPVGEAMRLFTELQLRGVPSQLLLFPDENHWILKPQNSRVWYQAVLAFLDHHVRGMPWTRPPLL